jgi:hypothetical protein
MFAANKLVLNVNQTNTVKFITKNSLHSTLCIGYKEKCTEEMVSTKFLSLQADNHINWENHFEKMIP